ncbi:MAG: hypothetical protein AB7G06_08230 [Bdellovibrionales bacterium]
MRFIGLFLLLFMLAIGFGAPASAQESGDGTGPTYIQIAPFVIPVIGPNGPEKMVSLIIVIEVATEEKANFIRARLPRLNDAYIQTLYGALDRGTVNRNGLIDVSILKDKLTKATAKVLGDGYVDDVLVQAVAERQM